MRYYDSSHDQYFDSSDIFAQTDVFLCYRKDGSYCSVEQACVLPCPFADEDKRSRFERAFRGHFRAFNRFILNDQIFLQKEEGAPFEAAVYFYETGSGQGKLTFFRTHKLENIPIQDCHDFYFAGDTSGRSADGANAGESQHP